VRAAGFLLIGRTRAAEEQEAPRKPESCNCIAGGNFILEDFRISAGSRGRSREPGEREHNRSAGEKCRGYIDHPETSLESGDPRKRNEFVHAKPRRPLQFRFVKQTGDSQRSR
jgi:hypothetical protein